MSVIQTLRELLVLPENLHPTWMDNLGEATRVSLSHDIANITKMLQENRLGCIQDFMVIISQSLDDNLSVNPNSLSEDDLIALRKFMEELWNVAAVARVIHMIETNTNNEVLYRLRHGVCRDRIITTLPVTPIKRQ